MADGIDQMGYIIICVGPCYSNQDKTQHIMDPISGAILGGIYLLGEIVNAATSISNGINTIDHLNTYNHDHTTCDYFKYQYQPPSFDIPTYTPSTTSYTRSYSTPKPTSTPTTKPTRRPTTPIKPKPVQGKGPQLWGSCGYTVNWKEDSVNIRVGKIDHDYNCTSGTLRLQLCKSLFFYDGSSYKDYDLLAEIRLGQLEKNLCWKNYKKTVQIKY